MGRVVHGHGKDEARGISHFELPRQNVGAFVECGQSLPFLCLSKLYEVNVS
jgi:hypothetical protein